MMSTNKYILYWLDGKSEIVTGDDIVDAVRNAGYGGGALRALDFYDYYFDGDPPQWEWNGKEWKKIKAEKSSCASFS